jgi:imidazolonepropionase-like amidohydrolase
VKGLLAIPVVCLLLAGATALASAPVDTAFVDVNVVPMDENRVLEHLTVVVQGSSITAIGPTQVTRVPPGSQRVEGHGKAYLLPGLADMHTHVATEEDLKLFTANGVTTVLHMGEAPAWMVASANKLIDHGAIVGPRIFFSLLIDGSPELEHFFVSSPSEGREAVDLAKTNGYNFIKLYNHISAPEFSAIVEEAQRQGLPVIGHGVRAVGLPQALFHGQVMVAHAEEFFYTAFHDEADPTLIPSVVAETLRSRAFVTPNLSGFEAFSRQWGKPEIVEGFLRDSRAGYLSPGVRLQWKAHNPYIERTGSIESTFLFLRKFTKALADAGVPLLAGTDSPLPGLFPGYAIHDDLRTLVEAGLTPYQALTAATRTPGEFIAKYVPAADHFGMVKVGMKADLVLVGNNPFNDLETLKSPQGVMSAGRWRSREELAGLLDQQKKQYESLLK